MSIIKHSLGIPLVVISLAFLAGCGEREDTVVLVSDTKASVSYDTSTTVGLTQVSVSSRTSVGAPIEIYPDEALADDQDFSSPITTTPKTTTQTTTTPKTTTQTTTTQTTTTVSTITTPKTTATPAYTTADTTALTSNYPLPPVGTFAPDTATYGYNAHDYLE